MNTLKINSTKRVETQVTLELPSFFCKESQNEYLGVINSQTVINLCNRDNYKFIQNTTADIKESTIIEAYYGWRHITEEEFLSAHKSLLNSLSLERKEGCLT